MTGIELRYSPFPMPRSTTRPLDIEEMTSPSTEHSSVENFRDCGWAYQLLKLTLHVELPHAYLFYNELKRCMTVKGSQEEEYDSGGTSRHSV